MSSLTAKREYASLTPDQKRCVGEAWDEYYDRVEDLFDCAAVARGSRLIDHPDLYQFMQIADLCARHGWTVRDYVRITYTQESKSGVVAAKDLTDVRVQTAYAEGLALRRTNSAVDMEWALQEQTLQEMLRASHMYPTPESALLKVFAPFEAWFRVTYLDPTPERIRKAYGTKAHAMITADPELQRMLIKRRPNTVKRLVHDHGPVSVEGI